MPESNPSLLSSSFATVIIFLSATNQVLKTSELVRLPSETIISAGKYPAVEMDVKSKVTSPVPVSYTHLTLPTSG